MDKIRVVIVAADSVTRSALAAALDTDTIDLVKSMAPSPDLASRINSIQADAALIYNDSAPYIFDMVERVYLSRCVYGVIMVSHDMDPKVLEQAMNCGVTKVIPYSEMNESAESALVHIVNREKTRIAAPASAGTFESRVISVFGTKGGTGKTMFAVNLASALAQQGKRVALIDLDLQFGDVGIFLDIAKSDSIADVIMESAFDFSTLKSYLFSHMTGIAALCAPPNPENAELVTPDHVNKIITAMRPNYDYVVLDMPPSFNDCSIAGLERSNEIYFMLNPDIATLRNAKVSISVLESLDQGEKVRVVLNKNGDSSIKQKDVESVLERKTALVIPSDIRCAVKAVNRGVPIVIGDKRSPIASAITNFAQAAYTTPQKAKAAKR